MLSREFSTNNKSLCCILEPNVVCQLCCCCSITVMSDSVTPWIVARLTPLFSSQSLLRFSSPPRVCSDSCLLRWWCYLTISSSAAPLSFCLQSFPASGSFPVSWLFTSVAQSIGSFSFSISSSNEYSGLISFRMDWFYLLAVQQTLKSLQHHNSKASIL